ncbi:MAG: 3-deoxy-D-manno-octulosonic acid transferase [Deltaproteobacteria bacterium]|nr:MAG: 3-deoxy-D-manno-octulosonic acid transferase [Deltaproteobacteria bacterium]
MSFLYNILFVVGSLAMFPLFVVKALTLENRRATVLKRLYPGFKIPQFRMRPIWIHALSVGEVFSVVTLIKAIKRDYPDRPLVCSVSTQRGYQVATQSLSKNVDFVFFFPYDFLWTVKYLIRRVRPALFLLVETDLWPNVLSEIAKYGAPAILVNGRISPTSYKRYKRLSFFTKRLLSNFAWYCMQSEIDAKRIISIGAARDKVEVTGNIKFDQPVNPASDEEIRELKDLLRIEANTKVFLAGSTHEGEEAILLRSFEVLKKSFSDLILVVVPRDPGRACSVQRMFKKAGLLASLKTELDKMDASLMPEAIVVDTIGELRRLYAIADVVFVGKSLVNLGGQNPLEPAAFKKPILFGPYMFNFELIAEMLVRKGGAIRVVNGEGLLEQVAGLLRNPERSRLIGQRAYEVFCMNQGAVDRILRVIQRFLRP